MANGEQTVFRYSAAHRLNNLVECLFAIAAIVQLALRGRDGTAIDDRMD
jgi:hypothetical protein